MELAVVGGMAPPLATPPPYIVAGGLGSEVRPPHRISHPRESVHNLCGSNQPISQNRPTRL